MLLERGISQEILDKYGIEDGETVEFPYYFKGREHNRKFRDQDKSFRFKQSGKDLVYFGLQNLCTSAQPLKPGEFRDAFELPLKQVVICEGEIDALSLSESGISNVLSVPNGANAKLGKVKEKEEDTGFSYVWNCDSIIGDAVIVLCTDDDSPGRILAEELARRYGKERCKKVSYPDGCKDANEVLVVHGKKALADMVNGASFYPVEDVFRAEEYFDQVYDLYDNGRERGYKTGFEVLDKYLTIPKGQLAVVTGVPGHGKSEFLDQIAVNLAELHDFKWALCSFENLPKEHLSKIIEKRSRKSFWDWEGQDRVSDVEVTRALGWIQEHFFFLRAEKETPTIDWLVEKIKYAVKRWGIDGIIVDPYNELDHKRPRDLSETEYISSVLSKLKRVAMNHDIIIFFVAHPSKLPTEFGKDYVPTMYNISGSAHWYNKADIGLVVYRNKNQIGAEEAYEEDETSLHIQKVRFKWVGQVGCVKFKYDWMTGRYYPSSTI